jgi:CxxC motif-containing protein (DUF1111 family)
VELEEQLGDGEVIVLREPRVTVARANGDPLPTGVELSYRQAPPLVGMGLLEGIPEAALLALADPDDADGDGISGRANMGWDEQSQTTRLGRFGHKASVPRLVEQAASAFVNDMGLSNLIFPESDGVTRDVNDNQLAQSAFHVAALGVPAAARRDGAAQRGRARFDDFGVRAATPVHVTGADRDPQLRDQTVHPYTDLLLHDMGEDLADGRPDFEAEADEWRTPPLWGIGLVQIVARSHFLHDGRAHALAEGSCGTAVAEATHEASGYNRAERDALLAFLRTL